MRLKHFLSVFLTLLTLSVGQMWAETVTYAQTSASAASVSSGTAPEGSSVSFNNTYTNTKEQLTANHSMTLTLSGYAGYKITGITLSMKSNKSSGSGSFSAVAGTTTIASIATAAFNDASWNGSYSQTYVDVTPTMSNANYEIQENENVVLTIAATVKSLYCQSFTITYEEVGGGDTPPTPTVVKTLKSIAVAGMTTNYVVGDAFSFDGSCTATYSVTEDEVAKDDEEETVTPTSVTSPDMTTAGNKTITVSYTEDDVTRTAEYEISVATAPTQSSLIFTEACGGSGTADDGAVWEVTSDASESNFLADGIHYGTSGASVTYVQLTTSDITGTITKVVVKTRDTQATATVSVTVGGTAFTCTGSTTATNTSAEYTFTGSASGEIVVRVDRGSSMTKAIYVKSVVVDYEACEELGSINGSFSLTHPFGAFSLELFRPERP